MEMYVLRCLITLKTDRHLPRSMRGIILQCLLWREEIFTSASLSSATAASSLKEKPKHIRVSI